MRFALSLFLLLAAAGASHAAERSFPSDEGQIRFLLPSNNIGCIYTPKGGTSVYEPEDGGPELACDRVEPVYQRFILSKNGKAFKYTNVGDASCCEIGPVLNYGDTWSKGAYWCKATRAGLTCGRGKNGFFISRAKARIY